MWDVALEKPVPQAEPLDITLLCSSPDDPPDFDFRVKGVSFTYGREDERFTLILQDG